MKPLLIALVFFPSLVCAQDYSDQPHLGGDGSLDDSIEEIGNYFEQKHIRIISKEELEQKYRKVVEEEMWDFEETEDLYDIDD